VVLVLAILDSDWATNGFKVECLVTFLRDPCAVWMNIQVLQLGAELRQTCGLASNTQFDGG